MYTVSGPRDPEATNQQYARRNEPVQEDLPAVLKVPAAQSVEGDQKRTKVGSRVKGVAYVTAQRRKLFTYSCRRRRQSHCKCRRDILRIRHMQRKCVLQVLSLAVFTKSLPWLLLLPVQRRTYGNRCSCRRLAGMCPVRTLGEWRNPNKMCRSVRNLIEVNSRHEIDGHAPHTRAGAGAGVAEVAGVAV